MPLTMQLTKTDDDATNALTVIDAVDDAADGKADDDAHSAVDQTVPGV